MSLDNCEESENISESPLTVARRAPPAGIPSTMPDDDCPAPPRISLCGVAALPLCDSTNPKYIPASTNGEPGGERGAEETNSALKFEESVGEDVPWNLCGVKARSCGVRYWSPERMSDGLRNSVSGEDDLVFSGSPNAIISVEVKGFPGPGTCDASRTCGVPTRTGVCELGDPCTSGGCEALPNLAASP